MKGFDGSSPDIDFDSGVRNQLGRLPRSAVDQLRDELAALFDDPDALPLLEVDAEAEVTVELAGVRVRCSYDRARHLLTVVAVEPPSPLERRFGLGGRVFIPRAVRGTFALLSPTRRLEVETHLENLCLLAAGGPQALSSRFPIVEGCFVSEPSPGLRLSFTVDPATRVVHVHRLLSAAALGPRNGERSGAA